MIVDTSVLASILLAEEGYERYETAILNSRTPPLISVGSVIELLTVVRRKKGPAAVVEAEALIEQLRLAIEPVTVGHIAHARDGYGRFGRGTGRGKSGLNFGDCFTYALAKSSGLPLLFKGNDFSNTDLESALP